jgi:hypothetical protein
VIGETLQRGTPEFEISEQGFLDGLRERISKEDHAPPLDFNGFINDPLSVWIESKFGVTKEPTTSRLIRAKPRSITGPEGVARELSQAIDLPEERCVEAIEGGLLAGYQAEDDPETGFPVFAFRLNQFISRGDTVYATVEAEEARHVTVFGQQFLPGDRNKILLPLVFCRECGQEYYCVRKSHDDETDLRYFIPRELGDTQDDELGEAGFLYFNTTNPWPIDAEEELSRLPDDWLEDHHGTMRVRRNRRKNLPNYIRIESSGRESDDGIDGHYLSAPFRFCLQCGVAYDFRQRSDFAKLSELGAGGRSTATTILSMSTIRGLQEEVESGGLPEKARKLLSFTDNRQDAALQAGHFNDFIEVSVLRAAIYQSASTSGNKGITHETLTQMVFDALNLPLDLYANDPEVRFQARNETDKALRDVLGYRIYRDLRRGWRVTSPNLEQCGLLEIHYPWLEEVCNAEDIWENTHLALTSALPETRMKVAKVLLDFMRRELVIKVKYIDVDEQERIQQRSSQRLIQPWAIDENERMEHAAILFPRARIHGDYGGNVFLSARGGFGLN